MNINKQFKEGLITNNPVLVQLIGMCATMAITTTLFNGVGMGISVLIILTCCNVVVSALRKIIPNEIRLAIFVVIIAGFVTIVDLLLQAYIPALSDALGVFIPLIVVNCIIIGRAEAFCQKNTVGASFFDGIFQGLGYTLVLIVMCVFREFVGSGRFGGGLIDIANGFRFTMDGTGAGIQLFPEDFGASIMTLPFGGFITLGLLIAVLALVGIVTVVRAGVKGVATLFDDTQQKAEYEDRLEGLVLFDPLPFDGIENIDDLTLREAAVWGCVYSIQETQGSFDNYNTDPDTEQLLLPSVDVDAYLAKLVGPSFKLTHKSFEMDDMTVEFDETTQCYKIPVTGSVGTFRATVTRLFKKDGLLHVTVGYIPTQSSDDSILNTSSDTPTKYMDYLFSRQSGSWYLTGLTDSETKPESADSAASAAEPAPLAESEVNDAILATAGDSAAASAVADEAAPVEEAAESTPAESTEASSESPAA